MDKVVHFEVPFDDEARAKKFYEKVFGWQITPIPEMKYNTVSTVETDPNTHMPIESGAINGGMYKRDETSAKTPVIVIQVASVDEYLKKVEGAGGKVFRQKTQVGDMGFYAQVIDTENNIIGIWEVIPKKEQSS